MITPDETCQGEALRSEIFNFGHRISFEFTENAAEKNPGSQIFARWHITCACLAGVVKTGDIMIRGTMAEPTVLIPIPGADGTDRQFFDYRSTKSRTSELIRAYGKTGLRTRVRKPARYSVIDISPPRNTAQARKSAIAIDHRPKTAQRADTHDETEGVAIALGLLAGFVMLVVILVCTASRPSPAHAADQIDAGAAAALHA